MPLIDFPYKPGPGPKNIYDHIKDLLEFILRIGGKLEIKNKDSLELSQFKSDLLSWMNEELAKLSFTEK